MFISLDSGFLLQTKVGRAIEISGAANIAMVWTGLLAVQFEHGLLVERSLQNGFETLIGAGAQQQGALAGGF
jgi:hypothetical protein